MPLGIQVDDEDAWILEAYSLWLSRFGYVMCDKTKDGIRERHLLHRIILKFPEGLDVDHINGNKLDNRKRNLRAVPRSISIMNRPKRSDSKQQLKGIQKLPSGKYRAKGPNGKHWGVFSTAEEAHLEWKRKTEIALKLCIGENDYALTQGK